MLKEKGSQLSPCALLFILLILIMPSDPDHRAGVAAALGHDVEDHVGAEDLSAAVAPPSPIRTRSCAVSWHPPYFGGSGAFSIHSWPKGSIMQA